MGNHDRRSTQLMLEESGLVLAGPILRPLIRATGDSILGCALVPKTNGFSTPGTTCDASKTGDLAP
eukprot:2757262-Rhodomonas_salina.1